MSGFKLAAMLLLVAAAPLGAALVRVWAREQVVSLGYQLHQAEQQREALLGELQKAEIARAAGRTPQRIGAMAKKLGLQPARARQILPLRAELGLSKAVAERPGSRATSRQASARPAR